MPLTVKLYIEKFEHWLDEWSIAHLFTWALGVHLISKREWRREDEKET
jgi:hypothetical protein